MQVPRFSFALPRVGLFYRLIEQLLKRGRRGARLAGDIYGPILRRKHEDANEEAVVLIEVLSHAINVGYGVFRGRCLRRFNGTAVKNLAQLAVLVRECKEAYYKLEFGDGSAGDGVLKECVVLEAASCQSKRAEILRQHKIPSWSSPDIAVESKL